MCAPGIPGWVRVQGQRGHLRSIERQSLVFSPDVRLVRGRLFTDRHSLAQCKRAGAPCRAVASREGGFTLLELLIVISIIGILLVLALLAWRNTFSNGNHNTIEVAGLYWHFVDIVWVFLFPILYLLRNQ